MIEKGRGNNIMKHFEGKLGVDGLWNSFDYDDTEFAICY